MFIQRLAACRSMAPLTFNVRHRAMHVRTKLALAMLPIACTAGAWLLSGYVNELLGCEAIGKAPQPCMVQGWNVEPVFSSTFAFGMMLWMPGLLISGLLAGAAIAPLLPPPWGKKSR